MARFLRQSEKLLLSICVCTVSSPWSSSFLSQLLKKKSFLSRCISCTKLSIKGVTNSKLWRLHTIHIIVLERKPHSHRIRYHLTDTCNDMISELQNSFDSKTQNK